MSTKTRVLHVRVVGFSAQERQMLNSIFLLSVAPARQLGYRLWNPDSGVAPDMYLLDGDSESAVASWQATFASTSDRTLVVGSKNVDLGVAAAARPLGLKVVGAMDRLGLALNNVTREPVSAHDVSTPSVEETGPTTPVRNNLNVPRPVAAVAAQQPLMSASMTAAAPISAAASSLSTSSHSMSASVATAAHASTLPTAMTAAAPATTVLPSLTLQPNLAPVFEQSLDEKPVTEKNVERILNDQPQEDPAPSPTSLASSGVTPLTPAALSALVAQSSARANLRVVPAPSPLAVSLPAPARIPDLPMSPPAPAPLQATVRAPAVVPAVAAPAPVHVPVAPASTPTPRHEEHQFRVLAVDDSPLMRTFLHNKLQPYGIQPEFASSGEEALFKISKQHYDMIFLDVMLPGMDGYDVCKMIKKNKDNSLMKVVMLTSKDRTFDKIRGTMAGCDGYLTKPVDEMKLRAIIERHSVTKKK
jgi:CheY-like chemotaxis protein